MARRQRPSGWLRAGQQAVQRVDAAYAIPSFCNSLWGDDPRHQCTRGQHHEGACKCACGQVRS